MKNSKVGYLRCQKCSEWHEKFTMSSYRLTSRGPIIGAVCAECSQGVTVEELVELEKHQLEQDIDAKVYKVI